MAASMVRQLAGTLLSPVRWTYPHVTRCLSSLTNTTNRSNQPPATYTSLTSPTPPGVSNTSSLLAATLPCMNSVRTVVRYSIRKGKPKTVKAVINRFYRLDWGIYIRPRAGRNKHKWKKPEWINERGKYHVFCNRQQSRLFDKMTTSAWKKKRHYVDDPYAPYHQKPGEYQPPKFLP